MKGNNMNNNLKTIVSICSLALILGSTTIGAKEASSNPAVITDTMKLINIAGKQRMLSQRIAKDYLYAGRKVATSKANKQLKQSILELTASHKKLVAAINDEDIKNLLAFVEMGTEDFELTANEPFSLDNAQLIIDLSESMLEGSQYVVDSLKETITVQESNIIEIAGRQRMLAQRIAKYYIAYQSGIKDKNTVEQMNTAVALFSKTHKVLLANQTNTPEINKNLNKVNRLWKIVYKFYLNIEKGGLPLIVFNSSDDITKKMNAVTHLYVELYK